MEIPNDLIVAQELAYKLNGLMYQNLGIEAESKEYGACEFKLNNYRIKFRVAKTTPTKVGQFVTFWKRIANGPIMPYDTSDAFDFLVISVRCPEHFGQFVFPKSVLHEQVFVSKYGVGGKRAMRVYPPWSLVENLQAKKTQAWQILYYFQIDEHKPNDIILRLIS
jgi:hypothetical protein